MYINLSAWKDTTTVLHPQDWLKKPVFQTKKSFKNHLYNQVFNMVLQRKKRSKPV